MGSGRRGLVCLEEEHGMWKIAITPAPVTPTLLQPGTRETGTRSPGSCFTFLDLSSYYKRNTNILVDAVAKGKRENVPKAPSVVPGGTIQELKGCCDFIAIIY